MKAASAILAAYALMLCSCTTMQPSTYKSQYQSEAPGERGERAISSNIELVGEVDLDSAILGVFFSKEIFQGGGVENVLFKVRGQVGYDVAPMKGAIIDYDLNVISSLSVDQAKRFLIAIDGYLKMDPKSLTERQMYNFELYSGTLNMTVGTENYRPFKDITYVTIFTVTNSSKYFKTAFPTTGDAHGIEASTFYKTYELTEKQVSRLRESISAALDKSTAAPAPTFEEKSGA